MFKCLSVCVCVWIAKVTRWEFNRLLNDVKSRTDLEVSGAVPVGLSMRSCILISIVFFLYQQ